MLFCPKCGSIMMPKIDKNKKLLVCSCGFKKEAEENIVIKETSTPKSESTTTGAGVAEDKEILPLTDAECPKCKHNKAYNWIIQTRAADEAPTRFFKCEKCKHTWREYK